MMTAAKDDPFAIFDNEPAPSKGDAEKASKLQVANGGEGELTHTCAACKGRGKFISYSGRVVGNCFKCTGTGKVTARKAATAKGIETKKRNFNEWHHANHAVIAYISHRAQRSTFYAGMLEHIQAGNILSEGRMDCARKDMEGEPARLAALKAKSEAETAHKSGAVDLVRIEQLFDTARGNGLKKPKFRAEGIEIAPAPAHGANAGALYVTGNGDYLGKLVGGKFIARREAPADTLSKLQAIAADPLAVGVAYGKLTGKCCACGRELTDPVSVENGIGPICESNWGL